MTMTPSAPCSKASIITPGSTLPVHMTLTILMFGGYCILFTPARLAEGYPHQVQVNAMMVGSNFSLIGGHPLDIFRDGPYHCLYLFRSVAVDGDSLVAAGHRALATPLADYLINP